VEVETGEGFLSEIYGRVGNWWWPEAEAKWIACVGTKRGVGDQKETAKKKKKRGVGVDKGEVEKYIYTPVPSFGFVNNKITRQSHALAIYVNTIISCCRKTMLYLCLNSLVRIVVLNRPVFRIWGPRCDS
jgi:hypothetical protein